MTDETDESGTAGESKVERIKRESRQLRGTLAETLASDATHFGESDVQLLKFHGSYQQDDRDARRAREAAGEGRHWQFMIRTAIPAGVLTAEQYLAFDDIAERWADGTLRVTTRQGFQFHGVLKRDLKATIATINNRLATTLAACGDVERNVMACPAPLPGPARESVRRAARAIAEALRPASRAYHEIWLDGERQVTTEVDEPFYGTQYLPRKFKSAVSLADDNCVDIWSQDVGLVAVTDGGALRGFNLLAGGGLGMTHNKADTTARLAESLGFVRPDDAVAAVRAVAAVFRDHGNRADRRHARLKYLVAEWGVERFRDEVARRIDFALAPAVELPVPAFHDHLGLHRQPDGRWFLGVFIQSGRIADTESARLRTGLRAVVERIRPGVRLTAQQNILFTDLSAGDAAAVEQILGGHGVKCASALPPVRRHSMACPALPTCGLAVAESERLLPAVLDRLEAALEELGLRDAGLTVRMTGCPNGCARPYTADLAFVGRAIGRYHVYVGGRLAGDRVVDLYRADVREPDLVAAVRPLLERWSAEREGVESLGDFYQRIVGPRAPRRVITGRETPTAELVQLEVRS
jgi:ferredoxin-sulfite reductase